MILWVKGFPKEVLVWTIIFFVYEMSRNRDWEYVLIPSKKFRCFKNGFMSTIIPADCRWVVWHAVWQCDSVTVWQRDSLTVWQCDSFILPLCLYLCWGGAVHGGPQLGAREDWAAQVIFQYPVSVNCKKSLLNLFPTQAGCPQHHLLVQKHPGGATEGGDQAAEGGRPHARALRGRDAQVGDQIVADCYDDQMQDGNWGSQRKGLWNQWQIQVFIIFGSSRGFR